MNINIKGNQNPPFWGGQGGAEAMNDEHFKCEACGATGHINNLRHRITMPGDYCKACADNEKCAACGELYPVSFTTFKDDVKNIICDDCTHLYHEVAKYIKSVLTCSGINVRKLNTKARGIKF